MTMKTSGCLILGLVIGGLSVSPALAEEVDVELRGGTLRVRWPGPGQPLWQTGPTTLVYEGVIEL